MDASKEKIVLTRMLIVAACFLIGGCSTLSEFGTVRRDAVRNEQGHVVGYKQVLQNQATGEVVAQVALFTPMLGHRGEVVGYEESTSGGAIIRDLEGRKIGGRFTDLRSRGTNTHNRGLTIVFLPQDAPKLAAVRPQLRELMASLSVSELSAIR